MAAIIINITVKTPNIENKDLDLWNLCNIGSYQKERKYYIILLSNNVIQKKLTINPAKCKENKATNKDIKISGLFSGPSRPCMGIKVFKNTKAK